MGRRKGSKNKKTLLKEAEALAKIQQGRTENLGYLQATGTCGETQDSKGESKEIHNPSLECMEGNHTEYNSDNECNSDAILHSNHSRSSDNDSGFINVLPDVVSTDDIVNGEEKTVDTTEEKIDTKKKKEKDYLKCERCGKPILCEARKIDTNMITGMADYHRTSVRYVKLCDNCCKELSGIVDKWLSDPESGGNPVLSKWYGK